MARPVRTLPHIHHAPNGPQSLMPRTPPASTACGNHLIDTLHGRDRREVLARCERMDLALRDILHEPGSPMTDVYFPAESYISLVVSMEADGYLEVGLAGHEGMYGLPVTLGGGVSAVRAVVQGKGSAWRMSAKGYRAATQGSEALRRVVACYTDVTLAQMARMAGCARFHQLAPRVARWMLMTADRARSDTFHLTHEFLAYMLGVRRGGVTEAAISLQQDGIISYRRGIVQILSRPRLEAAACSCYAHDLASYQRIMTRQ